MNTLQVNFPVAPPASMPEPLQTIFFYITAVGVVGIFLFSLYMCRKHRSLAPLLMVIAAGAAILLEPVVGFLGHVVHPAEGSIRMFEAVNRVIPYHMFFAYILGFGAVYLAFFNGIVERSITPKYAWTACAITVCSYILIEIYPVSKGLWVYYDPQPLWLWQGMAPLTWSFMNTACEIMGVALIYLAWPHLKGWRQLLIIPLAPIGAFMGQLGSGWPMYSIMNSSAHTSQFWVQLSGVVTMALAICIMWLAVQIMTNIITNDSNENRE